MTEPRQRLEALAPVIVLALTCVGAGACAAAVQKPSEPLHDRPRGDLTIPPRDADADVPDPTNDPTRYEPLASLDSSQDGVIDEAELGIASERAFTAFDADADGELDPDELRAGAEAAGTSPSALDRAVTTMVKWDADRDGVLEKVEFATGRMLLLDVNGDARVDEQEWREQSWQHRYGLPLDGEGHPGY